jgi:biotin transport system substrate-specific component
MSVSTIAPTRSTWIGLAISVLGVTMLTALSARWKIDLAPVPVTLQVLFVLVGGLVLGARAGAASQAVYVAAITAGLPLDAGPYGAAVWGRPSAGYLLGFIGGAFVTGWLRERLTASDTPLPAAFLCQVLAGLAGVAVIYAVGTTWLTVLFLGGDWGQGWTFGIAPFLLVDFAKAVLAAVLALGFGPSLRRWLPVQA